MLNYNFIHKMIDLLEENYYEKFEDTKRGNQKP